MRVEVMQHYGLTLPLNHAGYFETAHHQQLIKDIKGAIFEAVSYTHLTLPTILLV